MEVTAISLARLVADMRRAQKEYFRVRSSSALEASRAPEVRVDRAVREAPAQPDLFGRREDAR